MTKPKPDSVRALTWEEMSPEQRWQYSESQRHRSDRLDCEADGIEYDPIKLFEEQIPPFHREKP